MWNDIPVEHVIKVERITGIPREQLRPDIYPPAKEHAEESCS
jgi:DNA-binding transcriptional regulator YdaS (Cro superfamily)